MQKRLVDHTAETGRSPTVAGPRPYALGYSESELKRLEMQSTFIDDLTREVFIQAGIAPGMRVLDLGSGAGDVSLLVGELVGPSGSVLGVDRSPEAVGTAERRAAAAGQSGWVRFVATEIDAFAPGAAFDAIIGRLVLMYLPDPVATLTRLSALLSPGGIVAFHEMMSSLARSIPPGPVFGQCRHWIIEAIRRSGFATDMGDKLAATFQAAGLPVPDTIMASRSEGGPQSKVYDYIAETVRSLLPAIERTGVASAAEIEIDTLAERLRREVVAQDGCILLPRYVGAWTRMPG